MTILIKARRLLEADPEVLWEQLTDYYDVEFDDSTIRIHGSEIVLSRYAWEFHKENPKLPLVSSMTILPFIKYGIFTTSTMRNLFNVVLWIAYDARLYDATPFDFVERVQHLNMRLYNAATRHTARHVSSLHVTDYMALRFHPLLMALRKEVEDAEYSMESVDKAIRAATKLMVSDKLVDERGELLTIPMSCIAGIIKAPQAVQAVFMRGTVPDLNMESIPYPLTNSLADGMNSPLEYSILAREGAISEMASLDDLQTVCYDGRKLALVAQAKQAIVPGDCGSQNYVGWTISDPKATDVVDVTGSDLSLVVGMWHKVEDGSIQQIKATDTHLYGKTIWRRSPLTCKLVNGHHICSTCFGQMSEVMDEGANTGVTVAKQFTQDKAQNTLSLKHLLASLIGESAKLDAHARKYMTVANNMYSLTPDIAKSGSKIFIEVPRNCVFSLSPLEETSDVYGLIPSRISSFNNIKLHIGAGDNPQTVPIELSKSNVMCMFSYDVLGLIKSSPNIVTFNDTSCIVDVTNIGTRTLFIKPEALPPISELSRNLSKIFERVKDGETDDLGGRDIMGTVGRLQAILQKLGPAHLSIVELLLGAYLTVDDDFNVHNAVNGLSTLHHANGEQLMLRRSLSTWMIYNSPVTGFLRSPKTFTIKHRDDSVLDPFIDPVAMFK